MPEQMRQLWNGEVWFGIVLLLVLFAAMRSGRLPGGGGARGI